MNVKKREKGLLIVWIICVLLLIGLCSLEFIRGTIAGFGNLSGQLTPAYVIEYSSNYPSELGISNEYKRTAVSSQNYVIKDNEFMLDGYEFIGWSLSSDYTENLYLVGDSIAIEGNITLYAQWKKIEVITISYGDVNLNGGIDEEDYSLIEKSINEGVLLEGQALLNADCNIDGNVDLVDADIIKQAILGTDGYGDSLPNRPVLKYEIYIFDETLDGDNTEGDDVDKPSDGDNDESTDDNENETTNDNNSSGNNSGGSGGSSSAGNGNGASGSGGNNNEPSSGGSTSNNKKPNSSNGSSSGNSGSSSNESQEDSSSKEEDKNNGDVTNKEEDKNVEDTTNDENKNNIFVTKNSEGKSYVWIIVVLMCFISLRLILHVINRFRKNENNNEDE